MAILLFGLLNFEAEYIVNLSFNRLHGDSFIWTFAVDGEASLPDRVSIAFMAILLFGQDVVVPWDAPVVGFNRLHGDSFIWTKVGMSNAWDCRVSIAFMAILLFGPRADRTEVRPYGLVSIAFMAILLFGHSGANCGSPLGCKFQSPSWRFFYLDEFRNRSQPRRERSFNRLHGDSFIWTHCMELRGVGTGTFQSPSWRFFYLDPDR